MNFRVSSFLVFGLFLSLIGVFEDRFGDLPYIILGTVAALVLFLSLGSARISWRPNLASRHGLIGWILYWLWIPIVFSWIYGVAVGAYYDNDHPKIIRNFFGLTLYVFIPLMFMVKPSKALVYRLIVSSGVVQLIYALFAFVAFFLFGESVRVLSDAEYIGELRIGYSVGYLMILPIIALSLMELIGLVDRPSSYLSWVARFVFFSLSLTLIVIVPASKGLILCVALLLILVAAVKSVELMRSRRYEKVFLVGAALLGGSVIILLVVPQHFIDLLISSYASSEESNAIRSEQAFYISNELTLFGKGLGAVLDSGYSRDDSGYGFELTYLNLLHKLGWFVAPLWLSYILTLFVALRCSFSRGFTKDGVLATALMLFLILGYGNPILLAPLAVISHICAVYLLVSTDGVSVFS